MKNGFLKFLLIESIVLLLSDRLVNGQNELDVIRNNWLLYSDAPNSLNHFLTSEADRLLESRTVEISKITTRNELLQRQAKVRQIMWDLLGPFPEKTPLNSKTTSVVRKNGYRIENIIYESLPGFYVTASLFIPDNIKKPAPAILFCSGHSTGAYRLPFYQQPLLNLVKKGFIVLAIDPIGQGERLQYFNPEKGESIIGSSTLEHSYPSVQVFLTGRSIARYFLWDGIRGIDYLVGLKEVDPGRIGVHGLSGGGTQTACISALDDRVAASAPAGYITSYKRLMESVGVQDGEQNFYHGISGGLDHADFIEIRAPKPTLVMATTGDFFSIQGTHETFSEVKRVYDLAGKPENIELTEDDYGHGYTKKNREAMYAFFQKYLQVPGSSSEEEVEYIPEKELQKTTTGQISTSLEGETVFSLNRKDAEALITHSETSGAQLRNHLSKALISAKRLSGYVEPVLVNEPVFTGRIQREGYVIEKYFVKGEGDYVIPYLLMIPIKPNDRALIYLHPAGKAEEAGAGGEIEWFVKKGFTVLAPDLIGIGEMGPGVSVGDVTIESISYNLWYTAMLIGRSITGIRAGDVVRLTELLKKNKKTTGVFCIARKELAPVLLHAAAFYPDIAGIALIEPYSSYRSVVMNRFYDPKLVFSMVPGALEAYDLPDLAASLAPRKLLMAGVTDGNSDTDPYSINKDLNIVKTAYRLENAEQQLNIISDTIAEKLFVQFTNWIK